MFIAHLKKDWGQKLRKKSSQSPPFYFRLSIKKILFPVQRVAKIEASRAAAIFFLFSMKILSIFLKFF